jgi:hypothetical protein
MLLFFPLAFPVNILRITERSVQIVQKGTSLCEIKACVKGNIRLEGKQKPCCCLPTEGRDSQTLIPNHHITLSNSPGNQDLCYYACKSCPCALLSTTPWRRIGERSYSSTHSLTSALDGGEWPASRPGRFTRREIATGTRWIGGWVSPRAVLDAVVKKILSPRRESNPRTPIVQPVAQRYTDWAVRTCITAPVKLRIAHLEGKQFMWVRTAAEIVAFVTNVTNIKSSKTVITLRYIWGIFCPPVRSSWFETLTRYRRRQNSVCKISQKKKKKKKKKVRTRSANFWGCLIQNATLVLKYSFAFFFGWLPRNACHLWIVQVT